MSTTTNTLPQPQRSLNKSLAQRRSSTEKAVKELVLLERGDRFFWVGRKEEDKPTTHGNRLCISAAMNKEVVLDSVYAEELGLDKEWSLVCMHDGNDSISFTTHRNHMAHLGSPKMEQFRKTLQSFITGKNSEKERLNRFLQCPAPVPTYAIGYDRFMAYNKKYNKGKDVDVETYCSEWDYLLSAWRFKRDIRCVLKALRPFKRRDRTLKLEPLFLYSIVETLAVPHDEREGPLMRFMRQHFTPGARWDAEVIRFVNRMPFGSSKGSIVCVPARRDFERKFKKYAQEFPGVVDTRSKDCLSNRAQTVPDIAGLDLEPENSRRNQPLIIEPMEEDSEEEPILSKDSVQSERSLEKKKAVPRGKRLRKKKPVPLFEEKSQSNEEPLNLCSDSEEELERGPKMGKNQNQSLEMVLASPQRRVKRFRLKMNKSDRHGASSESAAPGQGANAAVKRSSERGRRSSAPEKALSAKKSSKTVHSLSDGNGRDSDGINDANRPLRRKRKRPHRESVDSEMASSMDSLSLGRKKKKRRLNNKEIPHFDSTQQAVVAVNQSEVREVVFDNIKVNMKDLNESLKSLRVQESFQAEHSKKLEVLIERDRKSLHALSKVYEEKKGKWQRLYKAAKKATDDYNDARDLVRNKRQQIQSMKAELKLLEDKAHSKGNEEVDAFAARNVAVSRSTKAKKAVTAQKKTLAVRCRELEQSKRAAGGIRKEIDAVESRFKLFYKAKKEWYRNNKND